MGVLGIDLAARAKKTYACALDASEGTLHATIIAGCDDVRLRELAVDRDKVAIDAPFGWPREFVEALDAHRRFHPWPAPDDGRDDAFRAALSFRATDRVVMHTRRPLSVSTDKLGVTAMRCAHLLHRWSAAGDAVDRAGRGTFVEVYPAAALMRWGLTGSGYKGSDTSTLGRLLDGLLAAAPPLELSQSDRALCAASDDAFDALVAALVAQAALLGLTDGPPREHTEQAAEEGWIHLPLHGSLSLLARSPAQLRAHPAGALAGRLRDRGVSMTPKGYVRQLDDALLAGFSGDVKAAIRSDLLGKGGSELVVRGEGEPKFHAAHSSACLAANAFGPWLVARASIPLAGRRFAGEVHLEVPCSTGLKGTPPTLDCLVDGPSVLAVESKCTEPFAAHEARFSPAYGPLVAAVADSAWRAEFDRLSEDPRRYRFLDGAQLVKHYIGLRTNFDGRDVTLAYLYWEPTNAADLAACAMHRAEIAEFAARIATSRLRFVAISYGEVWDVWAQEGQPAWLRQHAAELRLRYDVCV